MKTFLIVWGGQIVSLLGSGLTSFGLAVWVFRETGQATPFALTMLFASLPRILLSPVAGVYVDRLNRRRVMILADSGDAIITLGVLALILSARLMVWHIYLIAFLSAVFAAFQEPAYTASISLLVPKKSLARANGMVQMGQALELLIAPLLAGVLFVAVGLGGILFIDLVTYGIAIGALLLVRIPQPGGREEQPAGASLWREAAFGWNYLRARTGLFGLLIYFALVHLFFNYAAVLSGPLVLSFASASVLGIVQTVAGAGMLLGSLAMSAWGGPDRRILAVTGFVALGALGLVLAGLQPSPILIGGGLALLMFALPLASGPGQAIFQSKVAPEVQGRVFAMRDMLSRSMTPVAFLTAGPLADYFFEPLMQPGGALGATRIGDLLETGPGRGIGLMLVLLGAALLMASAAVLLRPRLRNLERELPDVVHPGDENARGTVPGSMEGSIQT